MKPNRLMNTPLVQKGSIATAQIDQPELADVLQLDERMQFWRPSAGPEREYWRKLAPPNNSRGECGARRSFRATRPPLPVESSKQFLPKTRGQRKAVAICSTNLVFRNYRPTVKVRGFGFIAVSSSIILGA